MHRVGTSTFTPHVIASAEALIRIGRLLKKIKPDLLHAHYVTGYGFWGALTQFNPFVVTAWGSDILIDPKRLWYRLRVKHALSCADLVTCDGQQVADRMAMLGCERGKIRLIPFGVDTERFAPNARDNQLKTELGFPSESLLVISTRNLLELYDIETQLRAIRLVLRTFPQTRFIIVGEGKQRAYLEALTHSLEIEQAVRFLGWIPNIELPRYFASSDVYVSTALSDAGIATSTAEAMASGVPVVVTDVADNRDWIKEAEGGFLISPQNPVQLAERICLLLRDPALRLAYGAVNRKIIQERDEYRTQMQTVDDLYAELLST